LPPLTSSERGTVENREGILWQYIPKGTDLRTVSDKRYEVMFDEKVALTG